ncbi:MAG: efflux RND transporter periplasmic adaptor subunit, partial [Polyangiaceae bacterium]
MRRRVVVVLLALAVAGCSKAAPQSNLKKGKGINKLEYPVQVAPLEVRQVSYNVMAPGSIEAFQQVQITARVAGAVDKVGFVEGQEVKKGDLLVSIEPDRFQIAVDQAKASLERANATEQSAEAELARRQQAVAQHPGLVAGEEVAQYQTSVATGKADVDSAQQALRVAQLNLRDSYVRAPFAGVIQSRTVVGGQYLQPGAVLATLIQRDPLLLRFGVSEQDAPRLHKGMVANLSLRESARKYTASIMLVSDAADPTTRLVAVTADVDDKEHKYWLRPGAFCEVSVPIGNARPAIVVPSLAVQPTASGNTVYIVDDKNVAHLKTVQLGMYTPEGGVEVTQGLAAGELLVVQGFEPLSEGAPVKVTSRITLEEAEATGTGDAGAPAAAGSSAPPPVASAHPAGSGRHSG